MHTCIHAYKHTCSCFTPPPYTSTQTPIHRHAPSYNDTHITPVSLTLPLIPSPSHSSPHTHPPPLTLTLLPSHVRRVDVFLRLIVTIFGRFYCDGVCVCACVRACVCVRAVIIGFYCDSACFGLVMPCVRVCKSNIKPQSYIHKANTHTHTPSLPSLTLILESFKLGAWVVQLGVRVTELGAHHEQLKSLRQPLLGAVVLG